MKSTTVVLACLESLRYTYNKGLYSDCFRLFQVGTAAEYPGTCVICQRHKQREVAPATMYFHKMHSVLFINQEHKKLRTTALTVFRKLPVSG